MLGARSTKSLCLFAFGLVTILFGVGMAVASPCTDYRCFPPGTHTTGNCVPCASGQCCDSVVVPPGCPGACVVYATVTEPAPYQQCISSGTTCNIQYRTAYCSDGNCYLVPSSKSVDGCTGVSGPVPCQ